MVRQRRHHFGAGLSHQLRHWHNLIAARAQRLNQHGQRRNRRRPVSSAVMQQDHRTFVPRMSLHVSDRLKHAVGNLFGRLPRMLIPIVRIDLVPDNDVSQPLNPLYRRGLVVGIRLLVN